MVDSNKGQKTMVKFVKVVLSLHSIQLIFISALVISYLSMTAANSSNRIQAVHRSVANEESEKFMLVNSGSIGGNIEIMAITSQTTALGIMSKSQIRLKTTSLTGQAVNLSSKERKAKRPENKGCSTERQILSDRPDIILER
jgi:hypothetical protein